MAGGRVQIVNWRDRLRHAFAVPERKKVELTDEVRRADRRGVRNAHPAESGRLAVVLLEMSRPMNYVGAAVSCTP